MNIPARGLTVLLTGLSGAGKSTTAQALSKRLIELSTRPVTVLDGDATRKELSPELGFTRAHRELHLRRVGQAAVEITKSGGVAICALIAPYAEMRREIRRLIEPVGDFLLVYIATPLAVCEQRDAKGLYAKARTGLIERFTGVSDPYEAPSDADVVVDASLVTTDQAVETILQRVKIPQP